MLQNEEHLRRQRAAGRGGGAALTSYEVTAAGRAGLVNQNIVDSAIFLEADAGDQQSLSCLRTLLS